MSSLYTIIFTCAGTLLVTIIGGLIVNKIKNIRPKLIFSIKDAIPISIENMSIGAYLINVTNPSSTTIKDITVSISAGSSEIKNGGIKCTEGIEYTDNQVEGSYVLSIPFLKSKEEISITAVAENKYHIPNKPDVIIRSPQSFKLIEKNQINKFSIEKFYFVPGIIAALSVAFFLFIFLDTPNISPNQSHTLALSAERAGLYGLVEKYATNNDQNYFPQGPLAYSKAMLSRNDEEIYKYEKFIEYILDYSSRIAPKSECSLFFYLGKIELLLNKNDEAVLHFNQARKSSKSVYNSLIKYNPDVGELLNKEGL